MQKHFFLLVLNALLLFDNYSYKNIIKKSTHLPFNNKEINIFYNRKLNFKKHIIKVVFLNCNII